MLRRSRDGPSTRIGIADQDLSLAALILLLACAEFTFGFIVLAFVRRHDPIWWLLTGIGIAIGCALVGEFAYGPRNWDRTTHLELRDERVSFVPSRKLRSMGHETTEARFPTGAILEYHIETGDRYFVGDRDQVLRASLWIAEPNGTKQQLLTDLVGVNPKTMASNLLAVGIPFSVVKTYDSQSGEHVESTVTPRYTQPRDDASKRTAFGILIGTTNVWLGVMSAFIFHEVGPVVAIGVLSCFLIVFASVYSKPSKPTALVQLATMIPLYVAGYAFAVITVWYLFRK